MYHYNSRNLKYTIATLRFAEPYHCLRMLAAWAHSQTYEYHTYFSMDISAPDSILIDPLDLASGPIPFLHLAIFLLHGPYSTPDGRSPPRPIVLCCRKEDTGRRPHPIVLCRGLQLLSGTKEPGPGQGAGAAGGRVRRPWLTRRRMPVRRGMDLDPLLLCLQSMHCCKWVEELRCADPSVFCRFFSC